MKVTGANLTDRWYAQDAIPWWCLSLAWIYGQLTRLRRWAYRRGMLCVQRLPVPVVVVGNLSVGGTGKTPLTLALVEALRARDYHPGVVSRGYGGTCKGPLLINETHGPGQVGDESCLLKAAGAMVAVGRDRPAAARLLHGIGCDVIVSDDGLQHYRLGRDVEIGVIDGRRRFGNKHLLPAGPLREPVTCWKKLDLRVCNGDRALSDEVPMRLVSQMARNLHDGSEQPLTAFAGQRLHAVAGIGYPRRFFESLRALGLDIVEHPFADHHAFVAEDLEFKDLEPVLMTSKDEVKCRSFARTHWWHVPVKAYLPESFFNTVAERIDRALACRVTLG